MTPTKGRKPPDPKTLAGRMRLAAEAAGVKSEALAERLAPALGGLTGAAVRKWWLGTSEPPFSVLALYAAKVNCSLYWLVTGKTDPHELLEHLSVAMQRLHDAIQTGEPAPDAWERILGQAGLLEPEERRVLLIASSPGSGKTAALARLLTRFDLSPRQSELLAELAGELAGGPSAESADKARGRERAP